MAIRDLFGSAKKTAKKTGRDLKRAEKQAGEYFDRGVEAHMRGSKEVGERFGRANETLEPAADAFGVPDDDEMQDVDLGIDPDGDSGDDRWENDPASSFGRGSNEPRDATILGSEDFDAEPGFPDMMDDDGNGDDNLPLF